MQDMHGSRPAPPPNHGRNAVNMPPYAPVFQPGFQAGFQAGLQPAFMPHPSMPHPSMQHSAMFHPPFVLPPSTNVAVPGQMHPAPAAPCAGTNAKQKQAKETEAKPTQNTPTQEKPKQPVIMRAHAEWVDDEQAKNMIVLAEAVPVKAVLVEAGQPGEEMHAAEDKQPEEAVPGGDMQLVEEQQPAQDIEPVQAVQLHDKYGLNEPFQLRIGDFASDYYPDALPVDMADKTVLSMKVASETGEVCVMHSVPHTLAAVYFGGKEEKIAWDESLKTSKRAMQQANETVEKPFNYSGINMLVELESRQELQFVDARLKVFQIFYLLVLNPFLY